MFSSAVDDGCPVSFVQTGLVQTGNDSLFIEPVNIADDSFARTEHKVTRRKRSARASPPPPPADNHPRYCDPVQGERRTCVRLKDNNHRGISKMDFHKPANRGLLSKKDHRGQLRVLYKPCSPDK